jgi:ATP-dependent Lon protease
LLLEDSDARVRKTAESLSNPNGKVEAKDPSKADARDVFQYGVMAKISGVQGQRPSNLGLIVEGVRRFRIERFTQFKPYMECEVTYLDEDGM